MPGRGPQTFKKRQKEQERKDRAQEKMAKRLQRKTERETSPASPQIDSAPDESMDKEGFGSADAPVNPELRDFPIH